MREPSSEWTDRERLMLVAKIANRHQFLMHSLDLERVKFLATMPAEFLEANRKQLIEGVTFDPPDPV